MFSRASLVKWLQQKRECPLCKSAIVTSNIRRAPLFVQAKLHQLYVRCPNSHDIVLNRCDLPKHLASCPEGLFHCSNAFEGEVCMQPYRGSEAEQHAAACPLRLVVCELGCQSELPFRDVQQHECVPFLLRKVASLRAQLQPPSTPFQFGTPRIIASLPGFQFGASPSSDTQAPVVLGGRMVLFQSNAQCPAIAHFHYRGADDYRVSLVHTPAGLQVTIAMKMGFDGRGSWSDIHSPWGNNVGGPRAGGAIHIVYRLPASTPQAPLFPTLQAPGGELLPQVTRDIAGQPGGVTRLDFVMPAPYWIYFIDGR
jgi:hypothetical protein